MKIADKIVRDYIQGKDVSSHQDAWFYQAPGMHFTAPAGTGEHRKLVEMVYGEIRQAVEGFVPCNRPVWDALFPQWQDILKRVTVNLVVGLPEPCDAVVLRNSEGIPSVVLDLGQWTPYLKAAKLSDLVQNLLTHELCHVCISDGVACIDDDLEGSAYGAALDAMTFHEGFAHLVSYQSMEIGAVAWKESKIQDVAAKSRARMRAALRETDPEAQERYRREAIFGRYYEKFACMCGMIYLAECWLRGGIPALLEEYRKGYHGFADRSLREV